MNDLPRPATPNRNDTKTLLATLRWTTAIGAVSLTLAGWGLLSQAEALNAAKIDANAAAEVAGSSAGAVLALATSATDNSAASSITAITASAASAASAATATPAAAAILLPTPTPAPAATATATAVPATATPTAAPAKLYTLDVVQWVQNSSGEQWALVKDAAGTLWYIYGPDVERMEYGLEPEYQPQPANVTGTTRGS